MLYGIYCIIKDNTLNLVDNSNDFEISTIKVGVWSLKATDSIMCMCLEAVLVM